MNYKKLTNGFVRSRRINDMAMKNEEGYNRYIANKNEKKRASNEKRADKNAIIEKINEKVKFLNSQYGEEMFNDIDTFEGYENGAEELIYKFERKQNYGSWVSKDMAYRSGIKIFGDEAHGNNYVNIVFVKNEDKESLPLLTDIYILLRTKDKWYKASSEGIESFVNDIYDTDIVNGIIQDFESFELNTENFVASFNTFANRVGDSRRVKDEEEQRVYSCNSYVQMDDEGDVFVSKSTGETYGYEEFNDDSEVNRFGDFFTTWNDAFDVGMGFCYDFAEKFPNDPYIVNVSTYIKHGVDDYEEIETETFNVWYNEYTGKIYWV